MRFKSRILGSLLLAALSCMCLCVSLASADMGMIRSIRKRLNTLLKNEKINDRQYNNIIDKFSTDEILDAEMGEHNLTISRPILSHQLAYALSNWLINESEITNQLDVDTADLLRNLFSLGAPTSRVAPSVPNGPVSALYADTGVVKLFAMRNFKPVFSAGKIYNGIWGYAPEAGSREYALQCNYEGLNILDVTTKNIVKVQTIKMAGGNIWRDVATHSNYAYISAQDYYSRTMNNVWVVDLSQLSSSLAQAENSNPISKDKIKDLGYNSLGHTVNVFGGLLFLNTASEGCIIFDLRIDPMNPKELMTYNGECHDSYVKKINKRNILFSSDGNSGSWRLLDITRIRKQGFQLEILGQTATEFNVYAHESVVSDDGKTLFAFEESNRWDIAAYDISNLVNPRLIMKFQWSGDAKFNAIVHNGFVRGKYLHVAYYTAGYRVFDISDVSNRNIQEVGKYETYLDPDGNGILDKNIVKMDGAWNVYVGLPSGKVLIADTFYGTFIVEIDEPTSLECSPKQSLLKSVIKTDMHGSETKIVLRRKRNKRGWKKLKAFQNNFGNEVTTTQEKCLKKNKCYKIAIIDEGEDGICCAFGEGKYTFEWNGQTIKDSTFKDGRNEIITFGICK